MMKEPRSRRLRLLAGTLLTLTFAAGALVGMASERVLSADEAVASEPRRGTRGAGPFAKDGPLAQRLELTDEQQAQIDRLLAEDREKVEAIFREMRPQLRARYDSTTSAIRAVLTEEQQEEFDRYRAERRERMKRIHGDNHRRKNDG